jgi:hypothetical protein
MNQNNDLKLIAYIAGGIILYPAIRALIGATAAGATATQGLITAITPGATAQENSANAPGIYAQLMKRPPSRLPNGQTPSMRRFYTDEECRSIADRIEGFLTGTNSDFESIRDLMRSIYPFGVPDLRMIYAQFGTRREHWVIIGASRKNLFEWFRDNLDSNELAIARQTWNPANIVPAL